MPSRVEPSTLTNIPGSSRASKARLTAAPSVSAVRSARKAAARPAVAGP
jgi:hypothetical protein